MTRLRVQWVALGSAGLLVAGAGCATSRSQTKFDESRIAGMSEDSLSEVNEAKRHVEDVKAQREAAKKLEKDMERSISLAESERKGIDAKLDAAKIQAKVQKNRGEIQSIDEAPEVQAQQKLIDASDAKITYLKSLRETQKAQVSLLEKEEQLAQAKVDRAGFETLRRNNPAEARAMTQNPADFEARVADDEASVARARADVARNKAQAVNDYQDWLDAEQAVGARDRQALAPRPPAPDTIGNTPSNTRERRNDQRDRSNRDEHENH